MNKNAAHHLFRRTYVPLPSGLLNFLRLTHFSMKRIFLCLLLASFMLSSDLVAQSTSLGFNGGVSFYQGDLSPDNGPISIGRVRQTIGVFARFNHSRFIATRLGFSYAYFEASDADANDLARRNRNLSFQTNLFELSYVAEFNILGFEPTRRKRFSPYLFAGVAGFYFNPKTTYEGILYELQPLGTEGQSMPTFEQPYSLAQISIPVGAGLKLALTDDVTLTLELGGRKLFTDYFDDVSGSYVNFRELRAGNGDLAAALGNRTGELLGTEPLDVPTGSRRGSNLFNDWYFMGTVGLAWNLNGVGFGRNQMGCPGAF